MAFSYNLATSTGKVRFLVPDKDGDAYEMEDDEIAYLLTQNGSDVGVTAVAACKWLARKYSKMASFTADGLSVQNGQRAQEFMARAKELDAELKGGIQVGSLEKQDAYHEYSTDTDYETRVLYIRPG